MPAAPGVPSPVCLAGPVLNFRSRALKIHSDFFELLVCLNVRFGGTWIP